MAPPITRIYDLARDVLDAIVAHWHVDAEPLPEIQFVSNASPVVVDGCEFLAVAVDRTFSVVGDVAIEQMSTRGSGVANRAASVIVGLGRCVPDIEGTAVPPPEETEASAALILTDAEAIFQAALAGYRAGEIGGCGGLAFESWTQEVPSGGMGGGTLRMRVFLQ